MNPTLSSLIKAISDNSVHVSEEWCFKDRVFGGAIAALSAAVASRACDSHSLRSLQTVFLKSTRAGKVEFKVTAAPAGRSDLVAQVSIIQAGTLVALSTVRFSDSVQVSAATGGSEHVATQCRDLSWVAETMPVLALFDERAIVYPESWEKYQGNSKTVELWARVREQTQDRFLDQLYDIMLLDAHLLDPVHQNDAVSGAVSLDLCLSWLHTTGTRMWNQVRTDYWMDGDFAVCGGTLRSGAGAGAGAVKTVANSHGRVLFKQGTMA